MTTQTADREREMQFDAEAEEARITATVDAWLAQAAAEAGPLPF